MNRLKKIVILFVLPFLCLLMSVSYANLVANESYSSSTGSKTSENLSSLNGYTKQQCGTILRNYLSDTSNETYKADFETFKNAFMVDYDSYFVNINTGSSGSYYNIFFFNKADFQICNAMEDSVPFKYYYSRGSYLNIYSHQDSSLNNNFSYIYRYSVASSGIQNYIRPKYISYFETNASVYNIVVSSDSFYWDGTYYYKADSEGSDYPSLPSNTEIASAVQAFYNSDYYKNNKDFSDFMVLYSYKTGYFSFVGHNFGIDLGQVIVPSNYEYDGYSYNQDWWKFFLRNLSSQIASKLWNKYYWLYTSNDFGETITYDGKGAIGDLIDIHFATSSTIVYSTTDYPVVKIETDENGVLTPVEGTIPGNQYTYDENLDPTTNEYNPLENFIPTNPSQNILGDVDFDEINKVFEENKNILNIEGASWLFTANNKLIEYFTGFLSFLIVLILISRMLGG